MLLGTYSATRYGILLCTKIKNTAHILGCEPAVGAVAGAVSAVAAVGVVTAVMGAVAATVGAGPAAAGVGGAGLLDESKRKLGASGFFGRSCFEALFTKSCRCFGVVQALKGLIGKVWDLCAPEVEQESESVILVALRTYSLNLQALNFLNPNPKSSPIEARLNRSKV